MTANRYRLRFIIFFISLLNLSSANAAENLSHVETHHCNELNENKLQDQLHHSSIFYGFAKIANSSDVSFVCRNQLQEIRQAILKKQTWAIKVLDASARIPSGFVFGGNYWLGSREVCESLQEPLDVSLSRNYERVMDYELVTNVAPINMKFNVIILQHKSPFQVEIKFYEENIIHMGLCLPATCQEQDIVKLAQNYVESDLFPDVYDTKPKVMYVKKLKLDSQFYQKKTFKICCALILFISLMTVIATCLGENKPTLNSAEKPNNVKKKVDDNHQISKNYGHPVESTTKIWAYVLCYDLKKNVKDLFSIREYEDHEIPAANGFKAIFAAIITEFHAVWFINHTVNNRAYVIATIDTALPILCMYGAVDPFFCISGCILTINFLKQKKKIEQIQLNSIGKNIKLLSQMLFKRYMKLVPLYMFMVICVDLVYSYLDQMSIFHIREARHEVCSNYGWRNLFLIQNLFRVTELCGDWTWYLACDMQFHIVGSVLLFAYVKYPRLTKKLNIALLIMIISWTCAVGHYMRYQISIDASFSTGQFLYISPYVRSLCFLIGIMTGIHHVEKKLYNISSKINWAILALIFMVAMCVAFRMKSSYWYFGVVATVTTMRVIVGLFISWIIIESAIRHRNWYTPILEANIFQHFNKVSFGLYLLSPLIVFFLFAMRNSSLNLDINTMFVLCPGCLVIIYFITIIFTLLIPMPISNMTDLIFNSKKGKGEEQKVE